MRLEKYTAAQFHNVIVRDNQSIIDAMRIMTNVGLRLLPVVSTDDNAFVGVVADGDIRRFLTNGGAMDANVAEATNRAPSTLESELPLSEVRALMVRRGQEYLPHVKDGVLVALYVLWITSDEESLTAVIMAGGLGRRLSPLTDHCPKPLLKLGQKPILSHIIENLRDQGVNRFIISTNYLSEMIVDHYRDGSEMDVDISYVKETKRLGTGGALSLVDAAELSEPFLCLNGDILNDIDTASLRLQHRSNQWHATMVVRKYSLTVPYGIVNVGPGEQFDGAEEKPVLNYNINTGCYMLSKSVLESVPKGEFYDLPNLFSDLQKKGMQTGTYLHAGRWIDIGDKLELERARAIFERSPN